MFLIIGVVTVFIGVGLWWALPDSPMTCSYLTERERIVAVERVKGNQTGIKNREHKRYQAIEALKDPKVWILTFGVFFQNMTNGLQGSFLTLIIRGLGYDTYQTILLTMPISAIYGVFCLIVGWWLSTSWGKNKRIFTIMVCYLPGVVSTVLLYTVESNISLQLFAVYFINLISTNAGIMYSLLASNIAGYTKKSVVSSLFFISYSVANIISPQAFLSTEAPKYRTGIAVTLASFCANILLFFSLWLMYTHSNRKRLQEATDRPAMSEDEKTILAFSDKTDRENRTLIYSL
jgi:MFS transporter, ACS family, allantoate permease